MVEIFAHTMNLSTSSANIPTTHKVRPIYLYSRALPPSGQAGFSPTSLRRQSSAIFFLGIRPLLFPRPPSSITQISPSPSILYNWRQCPRILQPPTNYPIPAHSPSAPPPRQSPRSIFRPAEAKHVSFAINTSEHIQTHLSSTFCAYFITNYPIFSK